MSSFQSCPNVNASFFGDKAGAPLPSPANGYHYSARVRRFIIATSLPVQTIGCRQRSLQVEKRKGRYARRTAADGRKRAGFAILQVFLQRTKVCGLVAAAARVAQNQALPGIPESHIQNTDIVQYRCRLGSFIREKQNPFDGGEIFIASQLTSYLKTRKRVCEGISALDLCSGPSL